MQSLFPWLGVFFLTAFTANALLGQTHFSGLNLDDPTYSTLPRQCPSDGTKANLPPIFDLKPFCPEIKDQGELYSCVGWSVGYAAMTIEKALSYNIRNKTIINYNAQSALFVFNQINEGHCDRGSKISDAVQFLMNNGNCFAREFDQDINDCQKQASDSLKLKAAANAIADFQTLFGIDADERFKTWKVRQSLANRKPVIVGMRVLKNFYQLKNARFWWPDKGNTTPAGGHAMVVIGYDDHKGAFQLMNSWGKTWGNQGFIWIKYRDFGKFCKYAYVLHLDKQKQHSHRNNSIWVENTNNQTHPHRSQDHNLGIDAAQIQKEPSLKKPQSSTQINTPNESLSNRSNGQKVIMSGAIRMEKFIGFQGVNPQFEALAVAMGPEGYDLKNSPVKLGTQYQLVLDNQANAQYIYVFSIDAKGKFEYHFPKDQQLNPKFTGMNESALIQTNGAEIYLPGESNGQRHVLKVSQKGEDKIVVLYSLKRIPKRFLIDLSRRMQGNQATILTRLQHLLGDKIMSPDAINYQKENIAFTANASSRGFIVPLILSVHSP